MLGKQNASKRRLNMAWLVGSPFGKESKYYASDGIAMPIELGLWRVQNDDFTRVSSNSLDKEERLEEFLLQDPNVLAEHTPATPRDVPGVA